ncbi:MAG: family 78 glycoside hydrolase catalytic domain [Bacteroidota bacterium]
MRQTAYQVLVATSPEILKKNKGDQWNSGKLASANMLQIPYGGQELISSKTYWWKVRIWDEKGTVSNWSQPAQWTMGLMEQSDWQAKWISATGAEKYAPVIEPLKTDFTAHRNKASTWVNMPKPGDPNFSSMLLRKEFTNTSKLTRAVVHVAGLGSYELSINGKKVGDDLIAGGWSSYDKTVLYDTYDVTEMIRQGYNAIGLIVSNGVYNILPDSVRFVKMLNTYGQVKAIVHLRLEYADSSIKFVTTDDSWQAAPGPVTYMNLYGGEDYDARLEPAGWNLPYFKPVTQWANAIETTNAAMLKGLSCSAPPIKAIQKLEPVKITRLKPATLMYDLGQNASVMPQVTINGKKGAFIRIIPAELLKQDGTVDRSSATQDGVKPAWWQYTLGEDGRASYFPKFFYQGGRYLQVELFPAPGDTTLPAIDKLTGVVVHGTADPAGKFECSNDLFNRIYALVRWAQRSNMMSVLTDCPHREKMPWLEQYHLNGPSLRYNFNLNSFFTKALNDMADAQLDNGLIPNIAPEFFHAGADWEKNGFRNSPEWGSSFIIVPWQQYLFSGDVTLMSRYYDRMKRYLSFLDGATKDNIVTIGLGDWYDIGPKPAWGSQLTPTAFTATAIYYYDYEIMGKIAGILGKKEDAARFAQKQATIREAFNKTFYNTDKNNYATGSNTTCAMPLFFNLVAPENRQQLLQKLVSDIRQRNNSFTSGEVGYRFLLRSLSDGGHSDVVYDMNNQSERPGYGYQLKMGATSLTEKWDAGVGSFGSQNHFMSGQINEWFFNDLAGIGPDETGPGFQKIVIRPAVVGDLKWVKSSYHSASGPISVEWKQGQPQFSLQLSVPANTSATVYIPAAAASAVRESGQPLSKAKGIRVKKIEDGRVIMEVGSGNYLFVAGKSK